MTTILLVDDSRVAREILKVYLTGQHIRVLEAVDGVQALRVMHEHHPDLVLSDLEMPNLDGLGLCEAIRADARLRSTPVLVLSGTVTPETARLCRAAGAQEVLVKPIPPMPLLAAVWRHLTPENLDHGLRHCQSALLDSSP